MSKYVNTGSTDPLSDQNQGPEDVKSCLPLGVLGPNEIVTNQISCGMQQQGHKYTGIANMVKQRQHMHKGRVWHTEPRTRITLMKNALRNEISFAKI